MANIMDDFQFTKSLNALLGNETLGAGRTSTGNNASMASSLPFVPQQQQRQSTTNCDTVGCNAFANQYVWSIDPGPSFSPSNFPSANVNGQVDNGQAASIPGGTVVANQGLTLPLYVSQGTFLSQGLSCRGSTTSSLSENKPFSGSKRSREGDRGVGYSKNDAMVEVSEDEEDRNRRRQDRNLREQQRSQRVTQQIDQLRSVLSEAQIRHKPDKFSTLITVGEYIKQLQERSALLDAEHKKLIDTITKTNELANDPHLAVPTSSNEILSPNSSCTLPDGLKSSSSSGFVGASDNIYNDDELVFARNVEYKSIFIRCGVPLAVASIDGRLLDFNHAFEEMTGYKREEILPTEPKTYSAVTSADGVSSIPTSEALNDPAAKPEGNTGKGESGIRTEKRACSEPLMVRNLSLFNLLRRDCMERVFIALSRMLKHPNRQRDEDIDNVKRKTRDFWSENVRLNRNSDIEVGFLGRIMPEMD
jgi:PAS domain-containing protein